MTFTNLSILNQSLKTVHKILYRTAFIIGGLALLAYFAFGFVMVVNDIQDVDAYDAAISVSISILAFILALIIGALSFFVGRWQREVAFRLAGRRKSKTIPLEPMEKEPGWNKAVLHWFHNGPENRPQSDEFDNAFEARSQVPPKSKSDG